MERRIAAVLLLTPTLLAGCTSLQSGLANCTTVPEVARRVDSAPPIGSTRQEIEAWLTGQGIEHSFTDHPRVHRGGGQWVRDENCSGIIGGIIRDTDRSLLVTGNIRVI